MMRLPQFTFGQYSDDTQLTREFLATVAQTQGIVDPNVFAARMAALFVPGCYRVVEYGDQTARALQAVRMGTHSTESGCTKGQGNGGAMRSDIIGLVVPEADIDRTASACDVWHHTCKP